MPYGNIDFSLPHGKNRLHLPDGDTSLALQPRPITAIFLRPYSRAPSWQYSFGLIAAPHHGDIPSALQPRPITARFIRPYSRAPSRRLSIFLCLLARIDFIPPYGNSRLTAIINFSLPLGKNQFHSALWRFTPHGDN